ncbi:MAG TPA: hypothetical protein ACFYEC_04365 [Candidatus Brocadiaceae bacterium]
MQYLLPLCIVIVIFYLRMAKWRAANQRRKELLAWAQSKGLQFNSARHYGSDYRFPTFSCFQQGSSSYACNVITGSIADREFLGFDYSSNTPGKRADHRFSAIILQSPILLKPLLIRPEKFIDKITEFAGFNDIHFESAEFNRKFNVKSPDKRWAYDVIHPRMMEFLLASPVFTIQLNLTQIMASRNHTFSVSDYESAVGVIEGMLDRLPEYLLKQQQGTS